MTKTISAIITALFFTALMTTAAMAASVTCTVETVEADKVILQCGDKAKKLKPGITVKVKEVVKRKAVEGC